MPIQIEEVYAELGRVLEHPKEFGLGDRVPQPLADRLESMRKMLKEVLKELEDMRPEGDLEAELSQDADQDSGRPQV